MASESSEKSSQKKESYWQKHITECSGSGLSQAEYCRRFGIGLSTFHYWKKRLSSQRTSAEERSIIALPFPQPSLPISPPLKALMVHVGSDFRIEIGGDFCPEILEKVITTLERLS